MQLSMPFLYGTSFMQSSLRMRLSSASSLPAASERSAVSFALASGSFSRLSFSSSSFFSLLAALSSPLALSLIKNVAALFPSGSISFSASVCAGMSIPCMCALAFTSSSTGYISSVCNKNRFSSNSSSSLSCASSRFITLLRMSFMGIISRSSLP